MRIRRTSSERCKETTIGSSRRGCATPEQLLHHRVPRHLIENHRDRFDAAIIEMKPLDRRNDTYGRVRHEVVYQADFVAVDKDLLQIVSDMYR